MQLSQSLLDQVRTLANEAGKHLTHFYQQNVTIQTKSDNTPVTEAELFQRKTAISPLNNAKLGTLIGYSIPLMARSNLLIAPINSPY